MQKTQEILKKYTRILGNIKKIRISKGRNTKYNLKLPIIPKIQRKTRIPTILKSTIQ